MVKANFRQFSVEEPVDNLSPMPFLFDTSPYQFRRPHELPVNRQQSKVGQSGSHIIQPILIALGYCPSRFEQTPQIELSRVCVAES